MRLRSVCRSALWPLCFSLVVACQKPPAKTPAEWALDLSSEEADARQAAAVGLREGDGPDEEATLAIIKAMETERNTTVFMEMLVSLGESGQPAARNWIESRINDPSSDMRHAARKAFKRWLVRNGQWDPKHDLPEPPHPIYGAATQPATPAVTAPVVTPPETKPATTP